MIADYVSNRDTANLFTALLFALNFIRERVVAEHEPRRFAFAFASFTREASTIGVPIKVTDRDGGDDR